MRVTMGSPDEGWSGTVPENELHLDLDAVVDGEGDGVTGRDEAGPVIETASWVVAGHCLTDPTPLARRHCLFVPGPDPATPRAPPTTSAPSRVNWPRTSSRGRSY